MSHCRFSDDSDVYVFGTRDGAYECCACRLSKSWGHSTPSAMLAHLEEHIAAGHKVPQYAIDKLTEDAKRLDAKRLEANDGA